MKKFIVRDFGIMKEEVNEVELIQLTNYLIEEAYEGYEAQSLEEAIQILNDNDYVVTRVIEGSYSNHR